MQMIYPKLYQETLYIPPMDFTIHQYLLASDPAILFAAGTVQQAEKMLPQIQAVLGSRPLQYVFVSHVESDECGGVGVLRRAYPDLTVIGSPLCARELPGYGYDGPVLVASPERKLEEGDLSLRFFAYPSEVHLQNGLLCLEENSGILYTSDLFLSYGPAGGETRRVSWPQAVAGLDTGAVPDPARAAALKEDLLSISPRFAAVGHGFCLDCGEP